MSEKKWYQRPEIISGSLFLLLAVVSGFQAVSGLKVLTYLGSLESPVRVLLTRILVPAFCTAAYGLLGFHMVKARRETVAKVLLLMVVLQVLILIEGFFTHSYSVYVYHYMSEDEYRFNLFCMFPTLLGLLSWLAAWLIAATEIEGKYEVYQPMTHQYWFLPALLKIAEWVVTLVLVILFMFFGSGRWKGFPELFSALIPTLLSAAMMYCMMQWIVYPDGLPQSAELKGEGEEITDRPEGYCGIIKLLCLSVFTLGIYTMVWVYRMTRFLNQKEWPKLQHPVRHVLLCIFIPFYVYVWLARSDVARDPDQSPAHQVTACLFVPFYFAYWLYKNAQRVDALAKSRGMESNLSLICLIGGIFLPYIAAVLLQDRLNRIVAEEENPVIAGASCAAADISDNPDGLPEF